MSEAKVVVDAQVIGEIAQGLLVLVGVQRDDNQATVEKFVQRILNYRVFADDNEKMNLSLIDIGGGLLLVPQFTLAANTRKGRRPSFASAALPEHGRELFALMTEIANQQFTNVACGQFGADMQVQLINDGPVTFILD